MTLRCVGCHEPHPQHTAVCWVPAARRREVRRERRRQLWGLVIWAALGVAIGLLLSGAIGLVGAAGEAW